MGLDIDIVKVKKNKHNLIDYVDFQKEKYNSIIYWRKNYLVLEFIQEKLDKAQSQCKYEKLVKSDINKIKKYLIKKSFNFSYYTRHKARQGLKELKKLKKFDYEHYDLFISWVS